MKIYVRFILVVLASFSVEKYVDQKTDLSNNFECYIISLGVLNISRVYVFLKECIFDDGFFFVQCNYEYFIILQHKKDGGNTELNV